MQSKAQIDQVLRQKSEAKEIPGVVAMAATAREVIYQGAFGKRDLSRDDAMTADSVFWIASMSKAITTAAATPKRPLLMHCSRIREVRPAQGGLISSLLVALSTP